MYVAISLACVDVSVVKVEQPWFSLLCLLLWQSPEEINNMLRNYEQLSALHTWIRKRVERGLCIPESLDETTELVRLDPTGFPTKKFR